VKGVDYGCGSHYFVDDMHRNYRWDVIGFDVDRHAIHTARKRFPKSAKKYRVLDLLKNKMPLPDQSQDFVFCNAVIQHFSSEEMNHAFKDISRILKRGGVFLLLFKRKPQDYSLFAKVSGLKIAILNKTSGMLKIEDRTMKKAIAALDGEKRALLPLQIQQGIRLFHFFSIQEIEKAGKSVNLRIIKRLMFRNTKESRGVFTYTSGKGIPSAAMFFQKAA